MSFSIKSKALPLKTSGSIIEETASAGKIAIIRIFPALPVSTCVSRHNRSPNAKIQNAAYISIPVRLKEYRKIYIAPGNEIQKDFMRSSLFLQKE